MKNQRKNHSILKIILLTVYLTVFIEPSILFAQNTESQKIEQNQEELNQALFTAVRDGLEDKVKEFLAQGVDLNVQDMSGLTLLIYATQSNNVSMVRLLVSNGADVNKASMLGATPLFYATSQETADQVTVDIVKLLVEKGADVNRGNLFGQRPLDMAVRRGHREIIKLLVANGVEVTSGTVNLTMQMGNKEVLDLFFNDKTIANTILLSAAQDGTQQIVEQILDRGIDVNTTDEYGLTALHHAASWANRDIIIMLLEHRIDVDAEDNAGRTAMHYLSGANIYAAGGKRANMPTDDLEYMMSILLDQGADINAQDHIGWTPLHYTTRLCSIYKPLVELLLRRGANTTLVDKRGQIPLALIQEMIYGMRAHPALPQRITAYESTADLLRLYTDVYHVSTSGKTSNPGTKENPLNSIEMAIMMAGPGDTIYIHGGTYLLGDTIHLSKSGSTQKRITLKAYPDEYPILDFSASKGVGISIESSYWRLHGLTITNASLVGIRVEGQQAHHNIIERCVFTANQGSGAGVIDNAASNLFVNCDAYRQFDPQSGGGNADGIYVARSVGSGNVVVGCRSWNNSDDGFDMWEAGKSVRLERCYSWRNGENIWNFPLFAGDRNGFKLGGGMGRHILINCVTWGHSHRGFDLNGNPEGVILHNCTGWNNDFNYYFMTNFLTNRGGEAGNVLRNNLSYGGRAIVGRSDSQSNSWDTEVGITITKDDFLSLDDSVMTVPRNPDGSIPQNNFLKLAPTSKAIDAGTDVNMPYIGKAPDLGAFEYDPNANADNYVKMLHQYVRDHDIEKINEMLEASTQINEKDRLGYAPLHWACYFGYADLVTLLIDKGADPNLISDTGRTCLEIATAMDFQEIAELLKNHGAEE